jgi:hypothetical protein
MQHIKIEKAKEAELYYSKNSIENKEVFRMNNPLKIKT